MRRVEILRQALLIALAVAFSVMGGAKLAVWSTTLGRADQWPTTLTWKAVLSVAGVVEMAIGLALALARSPRYVLRWTLRLLVAYACVLIVGELTIGGFSRRCGCVGPGVALGLAEHLVLTGVLIASTFWCERLCGAS